MRATGRLLQSCRITLFTREHCGLCTEAKAVLSKVQSVRPFEFREVDIIDPGAKGWRDLYDFDVPVVSLSSLSSRSSTGRPPAPPWRQAFLNDVFLRLDPHQQIRPATGGAQTGFRGRQVDASLHRRPSKGKDGFPRSAMSKVASFPKGLLIR